MKKEAKKGDDGDDGDRDEGVDHAVHENKVRIKKQKKVRSHFASKVIKSHRTVV